MASTIARTNFEPKSDFLSLPRWSFPLADGTLSDPTNAVALIDGEWMCVQDDGLTVVRATDVTTTGAEPSTADNDFYPVWAEKGRYDTQALSSKMVPLIYGGFWIADTRIFDATAVVGSGAAIAHTGQGLKVATIVLSGRKVTGLVGHGGSGDAAKVVARVTKLATVNGGKLQIRSVYR